MLGYKLDLVKLKEIFHSEYISSVPSAKDDNF